SIQIRNNLLHISIFIQSINTVGFNLTINGIFLPIGQTIGRICKIIVAIWVLTDIVRRIKTLAVPTIGQCLLLFSSDINTGYTTVTVITGDQVTLVIDQQSIGTGLRTVNIGALIP